MSALETQIWIAVYAARYALSGNPYISRATTDAAVRDFRASGGLPACL